MRKIIITSAFVSFLAFATKGVAMNEIDFGAAATIASSMARQIDRGENFIVVKSKTKEYEFGWVFYIWPDKYAENMDIKYAKPGVGPLAVDRDGEAEFLLTSVSPERAVEIHSDKWKRRH